MVFVLLKYVAIPEWAPVFMLDKLKDTSLTDNEFQGYRDCYKPFFVKKIIDHCEKGKNRVNLKISLIVCSEK